MELDLDNQTIDISPICTFCKNESTTKRKCRAFSEIPLPIWNGDNDHTKPYPGDNGIRFDPINAEKPNA